MSDQTILVTGAAGFIGFHIARQLLIEGPHVLGLDSLNDYYYPNTKRSRLHIPRNHAGFNFEPIDLADRPAIGELFAKNRFVTVVHMAAQAGVRFDRLFERLGRRECCGLSQCFGVMPSQ